MTKIWCLLLTITFFTHTGISQNLLSNGNFQTGELAPWSGYNNQVLLDNMSNSLCGNVNNGDGSLIQSFSVEGNTNYNVVFNYRWVSGSTGNYNMNVTVREGLATGSPILGSLTLNTTPDVWHTGNFMFSVPTDVDSARIIFYKGNGNRPLRIDNVFIAPENTEISGFVDPETPINSQPLGIEGDWVIDFSDEFNSNDINPNKWVVSVSSNSRAPRPSLGISSWFWVEDNAFLNGDGQLVLRGTKVNSNTMHCGSIESRGLYETAFGFLEARIKIAETAKGNHTAFWLQGANQSVVNNSAEVGAEIDIFESAWVNNTTKAVVHFDGYGADRKNHTIPYNTPNLHVGYHTFGLHWTPEKMDIYYDGVKVVSTNPNKPFPFTVDPNGYPLVPQVPEWLWLSVGASFADGDFISQPIGTLSDALVDYVRVYKSAETLSHINFMVNQKNFNLYPNPANNVINISTNASIYSLEIIDMNGKLLRKFTEKGNTIIDVSNFAKGMYIFKIVEGNSISSHQIMIH